MKSPLALYDPRNGDLALQVADLDLAAGLHEPARTNFFSIYHVRQGSGHFWADSGCHPFAANSLLFFVPYQYVRISPDVPVAAAVLQFHANFLCIETYHAEVGCNGVLFNDPYGIPALSLNEESAAEVADLIARVRRELADGGLAHVELLVSYLKVLLVLASRLKLRQRAGPGAPTRRPEVLQQLLDLIETHYQHAHAPAEYAELLHTTPKALGRVVRVHLGKTVTDLIRDRILKHAKWELLHTLRPVKEVARAVGFDDELYFSRLFRKATGLSPTHFREFETAIRGGSNLSMSSAGPSIPQSPVLSQNPRITRGRRKPGG